MILTFCSKSAQIFFRQQKLKKGPIMLNQLIQNPVANNVDRSIPCSNRLTHENLQIQRSIRQLKANNKIHSVRYRDCFFQIKRDDKSAFIPVSTCDFLHELFEFDVTSY
jgi:hypothetical protein